MDTYIFFYELIDNNGKILSGIVTAKTFTEAMTQIENYFGEDFMAVKRMEIADTSMFFVCGEKDTAVLHDLFSNC